MNQSFFYRDHCGPYHPQNMNRSCFSDRDHAGTYPAPRHPKPSPIQPPFIFRVYFDGGSHDQWAYGSFDVEFNGFKVSRHRISFADSKVIPLSNNTAEYLALLAALDWLQAVKQKKQYRVDIFGDSQLVVQQVRGTYRCHKPHLAELAQLCQDRLAGFGQWATHWHSRTHNVKRFGH